MKPIQWKNCSADAGKWWSGRIAQEFFDGAVQPSLDTLDAQIDKWSGSDDPAAPFHLNDMQELRRVTTMAFCLSIQSIWERQIRSYVEACAKELRKGDAPIKKIHKGSFECLDIVFLNLRGHCLSLFPEFCYLVRLNLLANVCRHGDGQSSKKLWNMCPEFWPDQSKYSRRWRNKKSLEQGTPSAATIEISRSQLQSFVEAIISFWQEIEYIYLENIERKHESVEEKLMKLRPERTKHRERWHRYANITREGSAGYSRE